MLSPKTTKHNIIFFKLYASESKSNSAATWIWYHQPEACQKNMEQPNQQRETRLLYSPATLPDSVCINQQDIFSANCLEDSPMCLAQWKSHVEYCEWYWFDHGFCHRYRTRNKTCNPSPLWNARPVFLNELIHWAQQAQHGTLNSKRGDHFAHLSKASQKLVWHVFLFF